MPAPERPNAPDPAAAGRARVLRLHRAVVRLSLDPELAAALAAGADDLGLDAADLALLRAVDPRAWGVDRFRRARLLTAILEELPVTGALLGPGPVDAFLVGPGFAALLERRGSLAVDAARALAPAAGPLGALERAMAEARRAAPTPGAGVALADGAALLGLPAGAVAAYGEARARLGDDPLHAIVEEGLRLRPPALGPGVEHALVRPLPSGQVDLQLVAPALRRLLEGLAAPRPWPQALALARKRGAGGGADALLRELIAEGLLRQR